MDKTLISVNVPNFVTINIMAWFGLLVVVVIYQTAFKAKKEQIASTAGGY